MSNANKIQVGGDHYKAGLQHWDLLPMVGYNEGYYIGCATKYVARYKKKNGIEDLKKAGHFCEKLIELLRQREFHLPNVSRLTVDHARDTLERFVRENEQDEDQTFVLERLIGATDCTHIEQALDRIEMMIRGFE